MTLIKERIKNKIDNSDDMELLELIETLFDENDKPSIQLSQKEKDTLKVSLQQMKEGNTISNDEVQKEIDKWLTK